MPDGSGSPSGPTRATRGARQGASARGTGTEREVAGEGRPRAPRPAAVAKIAARAQAIGAEAGSKFTGAMRELVYAAAGLTGFAVETARDVVQFLVRRGQIPPEEGERLLREAEAASKRRGAARGRVPQPTEAAPGAGVAKAPAKRARKRAAKRAPAPDAAPAAVGADAAAVGSAEDEGRSKGGTKRAAKRAEGAAPARGAPGGQADGPSAAAAPGGGARGTRGRAKAGAKRREG